jgi:outer membrane protein assembly factor BamB
MFKMNQFGMASLCLSLTLCVLSAAATPPAQREAEQILAATAVKGGLVVHIGCGDGTLTAALHANSRYLVHGLDKDTANVERARKYIQSLGLYGQVSAEQWNGKYLPYTDNLVNLLVAEQPIDVAHDELMRVLAPDGVAYIKQDGEWTKTIKPWPKDIDEWTHFLHGPDNNAVAHDKRVGPPHHIQWQGGPKFARAHEQLASLSDCVTAGGRIFYIIDEAPQADIRLPSQWALVARDAFSGVVLWKRPIGTWANQLRPFRAGPPDLAFRLVAGHEHLYVTLAIDAPVSVLDPATGETLWVYQGTENTRQIVHVGNTLVLLIDTEPQTTERIDSEIRRGVEPAPGLRRIVAVDASKDKTLWSRKVDSLVHPTLAAHGDRLFYQTHDSVFCLNTATGEELWHASTGPLDLKGHEAGWESPTLVVQGKVVYAADFRQTIAFSTDDGRRLWAVPSSVGYNSPPDIFLIDGLLWTKGKNVERTAFDPATGTLEKEFSSIKGYMHHRCYRDKATDRFMLIGDQGVQFLDVKSGEIWKNYWIRGTCQYGIMPANGLLYVTPDSCACNLTTKLNGFYALAASLTPAAEGRDDVRLEKGPAYGQVSDPTPDARDWPMYRHDAARTGMTQAGIGASLKHSWRSRLGGKLSGLVIADGKVFTASIDTHTVYALDEQDGHVLWQYTAGGRVDSPPTVYEGMVLFGSADGCVYALRSRDGELVWRFRAAPQDRLVVVNGQLESVWPVHGSVLVKDGVLFIAAGRSSYLDGGIRLYKLDPQTGRQLSTTTIYSPDPKTGKQPSDAGKEMRGVLSDILLADGDNIYMRHLKLNFQTGSDRGAGLHLFTPIGFLDDTWWHRGYWVLNDQFLSHWSAWWKVGNQVPSGRILSYNESCVFGYGRDKYVGGNTGQWRGGEKYQLFGYDRHPGGRPDVRFEEPPARRNRRAGARNAAARELKYRWTQRVPLSVTAMVVADKTMFIAGPPDVVRTQSPTGAGALVLEGPADVLAAWQGKKGALLWAVSTRDGSRLAEYKLDAAPVFDGMAAADGHLYLSMKDGSILCLTAASKSLAKN